MDPNAGACTVEEVLETAQATSKECKNTSLHLIAETHKLLSLTQALTLVCDRLESVVNEDEVVECLEAIIIGTKEKPYSFLAGLDEDLKAICVYLKNIRQSLGPDPVMDEVNVYTRVLGQYSRVLEMVEKRNTK
jgi:hypothetical protein